MLATVSICLVKELELELPAVTGLAPLAVAITVTLAPELKILKKGD